MILSNRPFFASYVVRDTLTMKTMRRQYYQRGGVRMEWKRKKIRTGNYRDCVLGTRPHIRSFQCDS